MKYITDNGRCMNFLNTMSRQNNFISQTTINEKISFSGVGIHNGKAVNFSLLPAEVDTGIVFRRTDLDKNNEIKVNFNNIIESKFCSKIKNKNNVITFPSNVSKIERQVEAILFSASEPLDIETIEKRAQSSSDIAKILEKLPRSETKILSMQSNFFSVLISFFKKFKVIIRVSEDPCGATKYADEKIISIFILISKFFTYNLSDSIIVNANKSFNCVKKFVLNKKKIKLLYNPSIDKLSKFRSNKNDKILNYVLLVQKSICG